MNTNPPGIILVTLLIKLGVIASLASIIARFAHFRRLIFLEERNPKQKLLFAAVLGVPFMMGVLTRLLTHGYAGTELKVGYPGADLSLEGTALAGLLGGSIVGLVVGMMVSLPAVLIVLATLIGVGLPLRIWNTTRMQRKLEEQERLLMQARVDALISQINPHFLFNTLNTVSSLIRFDPDTARTVLLKLSNILRRRLKTQVHFLPLKQEIEFIDDYLDIEVVRFGRDKLRIRKEVDPEALDVFIPSMILQPLVENAIRHGIAPKVEGGTIVLRVARDKGRLVVEVIDDGVGI